MSESTLRAVENPVDESTLENSEQSEELNALLTESISTINELLGKIEKRGRTSIATTLNNTPVQVESLDHNTEFVVTFNGSFTILFQGSIDRLKIFIQESQDPKSQEFHEIVSARKNTSGAFETTTHPTPAYNAELIQQILKQGMPSSVEAVKLATKQELERNSIMKDLQTSINDTLHAKAAAAAALEGFESIGNVLGKPLPRPTSDIKAAQRRLKAAETKVRAEMSDAVSATFQKEA